MERGVSYNATHTYKIAGPLRAAASGRDPRYLRCNDLGCVELTADGRGFHHSLDAQPSVQVLDGGRRPDERLAAQLTDELNRPFERPRVSRCGSARSKPATSIISAWPTTTGSPTASARLILGHVIGRYCGLRIPENDKPMAFYPGTYRDVRLASARSRSGRRTLRSLRSWAQQRLAGWPTDISNLPMDVRYEVHRLQPGTVERLRAFAHSCGAKVHDVILAALARAMAESSSAYFPRSPRRGLGLGTIVDTRPGADADLSQSLGMFLAYYLVHCRPDRNASLADLVRQMAVMTGRAKSGGRYLDSLASMTLQCDLEIPPNWYKPRFAQDTNPWTRAPPTSWCATRGLIATPRAMCWNTRAPSTGPYVSLVLAYYARRPDESGRHLPRGGLFARGHPEISADHRTDREP